MNTQTPPQAGQVPVAGVVLAGRENRGGWGN